MSTFSDRRQARANVTIDILPPEDGNAKVIHFRRPNEVVDAHFEPVGKQPVQRTAPRSRNDNAADRRPASKTEPQIATTAFATVTDAIERRLLRLSPDAFLALVAAISVAVFTIFGGLSLINGSGDAPVSGPALDITHVTMTPQDANGMRVLLINGIVENRTEGRLAMPAIRAELMSGETIVASTLITTETTQIGGRESYGFSARVPHPGGKLPDLRLALTDRGA
jgi:hypothetical protein